MSIVKIKDKTFKTSIPEAEILKKVQVVADRINKDYEGRKPVFLAVLNGSFIFAADLMRMITVPSEISFVKYASYEGTSYANLAPGISLTSEEYGIGFRKDSDVTAKVNEIMAKFKADGTLQALADKYSLTLA